MNHKPKTPAVTVEVGPYLFASPDMVGRHMGNGKFWSVGVVLQHNIDVVLSVHNDRHAVRDKPVSFATMEKRAYEIKSAGWTLIRKGLDENDPLSCNAMRLMIPTNIRKRHILKLTRTWEKDIKLSVSTVIQKKSILNVFMTWMGKAHLMDQIKAEEFFATPELIRRTLVSNKDKSWGAVDVEKIIQSVAKENKYVALQMQFSRYFGLRVKESMMFRPHQDYDEQQQIIHVRRGTKGGLARTVNVTTDQQKAFLQVALAECIGVRQSMIPKGMELKEWKSHYYYIIGKHGVSRSKGIVPHGLRHKHAQTLYEQVTGVKPKAVTGEKPDVNPFKDQVARLLVSSQLGHARQSISSVYIGDNKD